MRITDKVNTKSKMSLVSLAGSGSLPQDEIIDRETVSWILTNEPKDFTGVEFVDLPRYSTILEKYIPRLEWFVSDIRSKTLHGRRHLMRVTLYCMVLAEQHALSEEDQTNLLISASLHDLRRVNDNSDNEHSQRSADWFMENVDDVSRAYEVDITQSRAEVISALIRMHESPQRDLATRVEYRNNKLFVDLIRTADALDRYIQPKLKWWIDDNYLEIRPDIKLKKSAFHMVVNSELNYIDSGNDIESVLLAITQISNADK